jgi:septal ring factor EnvC (AmiA/AmiB activator)
MKKSLRVFARSFFLLVLTISFLFSFHSQVFSLSEEECRRLQEENIDQGINCWQELLAETGSRKKTLESEITKFDSQIALTSARISQSLVQIEVLEEEITQLESKIELLDYSLDEISRLLIQRIKETYKQQKIDPLFLFFSSSSFSHFISRYEYFRAVQVHDKKLLFQMEMARTNYGQQKELKEEKQAEVERLKELLEKEKVNLSQQKIEKEHLLEVTENNEKTYQQLLAAAQAEKEALEKTMAQGLALLKDGSPINEGEMIAIMGNTGAPCCSTGIHLHLEIRKNGSPQNPADYLKNTDILWDNSPDSSFSFNGSWSWPVDNPRITQGYGMTYWARLGWYGGGPHNGIDIVNDSHLIKAPKGGTLYQGETNCGSGCPIKYVAIDHGEELISWYWHVQ